LSTALLFSLPLAAADDNTVTYRDLMEEDDAGLEASLERARLKAKRLSGDGEVISATTAKRGGIYIHTIKVRQRDGGEVVYVIDGDDIH
jgi:hypothetical protein